MIQNELDKEFDPDQYDQDMNKTFNENYYENPDEKPPSEHISEISAPDFEEDIVEQKPEEDTWWMCDGCFKPIKPGKY